MFEWLWDKLKSNHDQISVIIQALMALFTLFGLLSWEHFRDFLKKLRNKIKNLFILFIIRPIKKLLNNSISWIREIIIGKENLELLEELKILKDNKWAIDFLNRLREKNETKIKIGYEALNAFMILYSNAADSVSPIYPYKFEEAYKKDEELKVKGDYYYFSEVYKLRKEIFEKLIKNIIDKNNNN